MLVDLDSEAVTTWQWLGKKLGPRGLAWLIGRYPPLLGAGIRVVRCDAEWRNLEVRLGFTWWNRNYVGTQFGGSLYVMCDPFYMLMLMQNLGPGYTVWDKSASIEFLRPGRGPVTARFELTSERLAAIREDVEQRGKAHPTFNVEVVDASGTVVARVEKLLSVRRKQP